MEKIKKAAFGRIWSKDRHQPTMIGETERTHKASLKVYVVTALPSKNLMVSLRTHELARSRRPRRVSGTRVRMIIGFEQTLRRHMRVNLGRGETAMAEQLLDAAQVRAVIEQMRGETVP